MQWIKCSEMLPEIKPNYNRATAIVYDPEGPWIGQARYCKYDGWTYGEYDDSIQPSHWMPLPVPPKE